MGSLFEKISNIPKETIVKIFRFGIILLFLFYPPMFYFFSNSGYDSANFMKDQFSFSDFALYNLYFQLSYGGGNIGYYTWGQILDYGFMVSYGAVFFSLCVLTGRKFNKEKNAKAEFVGNLFGLLAIGSAVSDAIENIFVLLTLASPFTFPPIYAILMSTFALIKWVLLFVVLVYVIIARLKLAIDK